MKRHLLDLNVLLALLWPRHESHVAAHAWFGKSGHRAWATNTLTQLGVLRLLTNPAVTQGTVNAATAMGALAETTTHQGHEFWSFDQGLATCPNDLVRKVRGHHQWADAVLLWQAARREGVLVTFDSGVKELAGREFAGHVLVLNAR